MFLETKLELEKELKSIEKWEKSQYGDSLFDKLQRLPFLLLDKITPKIIHEKIEQGINEMLKLLGDEKNVLVNKSVILKQYREVLNKEISFEEIIELTVSDMGNVAQSIINKRKTFSFYQGATTGIGGIFTLAADIPLVITTAVKTIQEIGIAFGYEQNSLKEKIYAIKILQFTASDVIGKKSLSYELSNFEEINQSDSISKVKGWNEVFQNFRDTYGWKKLMQMVPVVGVVFGAFTNKSYIEDIGEVALMYYKKRRINERLKQM